MFNLEEFIVTNLIEGYRSNTFNEYQVNIYASGYMLKGAITQDGFDEILQAIEDIKNPPEYEELPEQSIGYSIFLERSVRNAEN